MKVLIFSLALLTSCGYAENSCVTGRLSERFFAKARTGWAIYFDLDYNTIDEANKRCETFLQTGK